MAPLLDRPLGTFLYFPLLDYDDPEDNIWDTSKTATESMALLNLVGWTKIVMSLTGPLVGIA